MIELGRTQKLYIDHKTDFGVYLCAEPKPDKRNRCVLLPRKQVPKGAQVGDQVEVFVYKDSSDREIATTTKPALEIGELAVLPVAQTTRIGAFLKWGLEKDLLLPFSEQTVKVKEGDEYLVSLYIDKSERLCATMKVYDFLRTDPPYKEEDPVQGIVYGFNPEYGAFVAVDQLYNGMVPKQEMVRKLHIGDRIEGRVISVREDGKMNIGLRQRAHIQMDVDAGRIFEKLEENDGFLPYHDKSSPEDIRAEFGMSKNEFKRAIGRLYKMRKIEISHDGIRKTDV